MKKITLKKGASLDEFVCTNEAGQSITLGNNGAAVGPMEGVLMAIAGCSTIDILMILEKMRQKIEDIEVKVEGTRRDEIPKTYTGVHLHYILTGDIKEKKAQEAIDLSLEKYCSVSMMIEKSAKISSSFEIITA